jgi:tetratricopeptide (TPR) repeat protein
MKWELPPPIPLKDANKGIQNKKLPELKKQSSGDARKKTQRIPELADDYFVKEIESIESSKLDEKTISLIQEFITGLFQVQRYEDVLHLSLLVVACDSDYVDAYYNGSLALFHLKRYQEAKQLMQRSPDSMWKQGNPHYDMACIEAALGNYPTAIDHAKKAMAIDTALLKEMQKDPDLKAIHKYLRNTR